MLVVMEIYMGLLMILFSEGKRYGGVAAVIFLLHARGNRIAALLLKVSGPLGNFAYKLIAANRRSVFVRALSKLLKKLS